MAIENAVRNNSEVTFTFPHTAVLYLRCTRKTASKLKIYENDEVQLEELKEAYRQIMEYLDRKLEKGRADGLAVLVKILKSIFNDFNKVYDEVIKNEIYADITREKVMEYYK